MRKFILWLEAAKNTDYIEKCFKQNLHRIKFPKKKSLRTPGVEQEGFKDLTI